MGDTETDVRARARVGSVLKGKYRLDRVLGIGGMAAVYAATHMRNKNRVAVKVLHRELARDEGLRGRFLREGYAANSVEHPGTVRILDDDTGEDGAVFLVMELLDGETLEARWERKRRLPAEEVAVLTYQLLDVIAAAHAKGVIHRDLKPENLFLTRDRVLKVLDFGVARLLEGSVSATRSGGILGTPAFMSPEQVLGKTNSVDAQSDIWSIGATAFTLLSGRYVHEAETAEEMMVFTASRPPRSVATVAPDAPAPIVRVIDRALGFEKRERWASARGMQRALANAYREAFGQPLPGARSDDDDEVAEPLEEELTVLSETGTDVTTTLPGKTVVPSRGGSSPVMATQYEEPLSASVGETLPMRQSVGGVAATRADDASRRAASSTGSGQRPRILLLVGIGGVAAVLGSVIVARVVGSGEPSSGASATAAPSPAPAFSATAVSPEVTASAVKLEPPSVAVEALPTMAPAQLNAPAAPKPVAPALPPAVASAAPALTPPALPAAFPAAPATAPPLAAAPPPAAAAPSKPSCTPPFTIDTKTGKKKWKVECL